MICMSVWEGSHRASQKCRIFIDLDRKKKVIRKSYFKKAFPLYFKTIHFTVNLSRTVILYSCSLGTDTGIEKKK